MMSVAPMERCATGGHVNWNLYSHVAARAGALVAFLGATWLLLILAGVDRLFEIDHEPIIVSLAAGFVAVVVVSLAIYVFVWRNERRVRHEQAAREAAYDEALAGWAAALDMRDHSTAEHTFRVVTLTTALAAHVGITDLVPIRRGALLHDIGKMGVPDAILAKDGPLTEDEWTVMRQHPQLAMDLLSGSDFLGAALEIPYCHHERWDGEGYPRRLAGTEIPLSARLFSIVDAYDALTNERPYRSPLTHHQAMTLIHEEAGTHFDPTAVLAFAEVMAERRAGEAAPTRTDAATQVAWSVPHRLAAEDLRH